MKNTVNQPQNDDVNDNVHQNDSNEFISNTRVLALSKKWYDGLDEESKSEYFDTETIKILNGSNMSQEIKEIIIKNKYLDIDSGDELDMFNKFRYNFEYQLKSKSGAYMGYLPKTKDVSVDKFMIQHESRDFSFIITKNDRKFWINEYIKGKVTQIYEIVDISAVETILATHHYIHKFKKEIGVTFNKK